MCTTSPCMPAHPCMHLCAGALAHSVDARASMQSRLSFLVDSCCLPAWIYCGAVRVQLRCWFPGSSSIFSGRKEHI